MKNYSIQLFIILVLGLVGCKSSNDYLLCDSYENIVRLEQFGRQTKDPLLKKAVQYTLNNIANKRTVYGNIETELLSSFIDSVEDIQGHTPYVRINNCKNQYIGKTKTIIPDVGVINADSIWKDIVLARTIWNNTLWKEQYDEDVFYEYVLPYRMSVEPIDYKWRESAHFDYVTLLDNVKNEPIKVCEFINDNITYLHYDLLRAADLQTYNEYKHSPRGGCEGRSLYTAMIMRSLGLPIAIDEVPIWGCINNGHTFNSLILPQGNCIGFSNPKDLPKGGTLAWKCTKVYRRQFSITKDLPTYKYRHKEPIAAPFDYYDIVDVTTSYDVPVRNIEIKSGNLYKRHIAYLAVPKRDKWDIVAYGEKKMGNYVFKDVGYGYQNGVKLEEQGEYIGNGIVYLPMCFDDKSHLTPIDYPFILSNKGAHFLKPDITNCCEVVLTRKYPRFARIVNFAEKTERYIFEGANKPDFSDAEVLYIITTTPLSREQKYKVNSTKKYKYARIRNIHGGLMIAEFSFCGDNGKSINGHMICHKILKNDPTIANAMDDNVLTFMNFNENVYNLWLGVEFNSPQQIDSIVFCPRTDDNDIKPGDIYELFYWDNEWISLGTQIADNYKLDYSNVPSNALLLLCNLSRGKEERPFTYENGQQIWW